jgi:hypothetical protein
MKEHQETSPFSAAHQGDELVRQLLDCVVACETCAAACLNEDDVSMMARCIELDRDCSELCAEAVRLRLRDSELFEPFLAVCEEACRLCAEECRKHKMDHCQRCADECERCSEACREELKAV